MLIFAFGTVKRKLNEHCVFANLRSCLAVANRTANPFHEFHRSVCLEITRCDGAEENHSCFVVELCSFVFGVAGRSG